MTEAIYISGKTVEEIKAEWTKKEQQGETPVQLDLTLSDAADYEKASSNMEYLLSAAGNIFDMLQCEISMGNMDTQSPGVISMLEMVGRGFSAAADKEGMALSKLNRKLDDLINRQEHCNVT